MNNPLRSKTRPERFAYAGKAALAMWALWIGTGVWIARTPAPTSEIDFWLRTSMLQASFWLAMLATAIWAAWALWSGTDTAEPDTKPEPSATKRTTPSKRR